MEIFYLHIKRYLQQFKDIDINFGGEYRFFYDIRNKKLRIEENEHFIKDFFKSDLSNGKINQSIVKNVSCIVGENGSGKSTLLNFIKTNLISGISKLDYAIIIALKTSQGEKIIYYFDDETPICLEQQRDFGFEPRPLKFRKKFLKGNKGPYIHIGPHIPSELRSIDYVFMSNIFDSSTEIELDGLYNLSTNYLIKADKKGLIENNIVKNFANEVDTHRVEDITRQVYFINSYSNSNKFIFFDLPETLNFLAKQERDFVHNSYAESFLDDSSKSENPNLSFARALIDKARDEIQASKDDVYKTLVTFYTNCFINFIIELHDRSSSIPSKIAFDFSFLTVFKNFKFSGEFLDNFYKLLSLLKEAASKAPSAMDKIYTSWISGIRLYFEVLDKAINTAKSKHPLSSIGNIFQIKVKENFELANELINSYRNTFEFYPHLDFKWRSLSSGQTALLNIYSRLYTKEDTQESFENVKLKKDIILMIDEADTYLHPRWSQILVQSIIDFVSDIYTSADHRIQRQIQIIFTSNSPFIAADIPSSNVVFLKRERDEKGDYTIASQKSLEDKKETFGANIHTLLLDAFFLPNGALGEFAKKKINSIIDRLNSPAPFSSIEEKDEIRRTIGIIGEPVIKRKLLQMYNDRFNIDIDSRIKDLEKEIGLLKNRRGDKN